jgi:hypothetical protein
MLLTNPFLLSTWSWFNCALLFLGVGSTVHSFFQKEKQNKHVQISSVLFELLFSFIFLTEVEHLPLYKALVKLLLQRYRNFVLYISFIFGTMPGSDAKGGAESHGSREQ